MQLDPVMEEKIARILQRFAKAEAGRFDPEALDAANRKQAMVPRGRGRRSTRSAPRPDWSCPPYSGDGPLVLVLPGPPRELRPMWAAALEEPLMREVLAATRRRCRRCGCACSAPRSRSWP